MKKIVKPLLEVSILNKQLEDHMMEYMVNDLGMPSSEAKKVVLKSKKTGVFDLHVKRVVTEWWSSY